MSSSLIIGGDEADNDCEDKNWRCIFWSLPIFKYCAKWEKLRTEICPFSCGQCPKAKAEEEIKPQSRITEETECKDESPVCENLSLEHCPGLTGMLFCKRTCGTCKE
uniref:Uncharacterized protein n=1 Tax=Meloidogyne enterolobii TaxID=390850 RepID=A0A6V7V5K8_MELEN|nr:unnamed protein product [Meloidogyne enterolobii]